MARRQPLIWASLRALEAAANAMSHERASRLGASLGGLVERASRSHADRARARASRILGVDAREAARIVHGAYRHFGAAALEFMRLPKMACRLDEIITLEGEEHLHEALSLGRGAIFLSAHIGCWEYGAALLAKHGFPMSAIGAEQRDSRVTEMIERLRAGAGIKPVGKGMDLRAAVACLKRGEMLAVLLDQDSRSSGIVSDFLGWPASTPTGPLRLAHKFGVPVIPAHIVRNAGEATLRMTVEPALASPDGRPFGEDLQTAADACNAVISRWIREDPDQWMWMYPRWATTLGDR